MKLFINSEPVDFILEENLSLEEIVEKVSAWASSQNQYVLDYRHTQKTGFENETPTRDTIEKLEFLIGSYDELILFHLKELQSFTDKLGLFVANKIQENASFSDKDEIEWKNALDFLTQSLQTLVKHFNENENLLSKLHSLKEKQDLYLRLGTLAEIKNQVDLWYRKRKLSLLSPEERKQKLEEFFARKSELQNNCELLATYFTTGKEQTAFAELEKFVEYIGDVLAIFLMEKESPSAHKLTKLFAELTSYLDSQDFVSAADLLDFDIKETIGNLS